MSTEMLDLGMGHVVFPSQEVAALSPAPRAPRATQYMAAMGLWRPQMGPADPGACAGIVLQCVHELSVLFPGGAGSIREVTVYIFVLAGRLSYVAGDRSPAITNDCQSVMSYNIRRLI